MGFFDSPVHGEIGRLRSWRFAKLANDGSGNDIVISLVPQNEVPGSPGRLCVRSIGTLN
ncbi:Putative secreted protein (fragment) [Xanthomonas citri pv. fuscans]